MPNKPIEGSEGSQYQYIPGQIKETGGVVPLAPEAGEPGLIRDELIPSAQAPVKQAKAPPIDAPELVNPTPKARQIMAVKREIMEQAKKNPWMSNPSFLGAFLATMFELLKNLSTGRFLEAQKKLDLGTALFKLGMQNADIAKELKEMAASKEFAQAVNSFLSAGVNVIHAASMVKMKGEAEREAKANPAFGDKEQTKITERIEANTQKKAQQDKIATDLVAGPTKEEISAAKKQSAKFEKLIEEDQGKLDKLKYEQRSEMRESLRSKEQQYQAGAEAMKQTSQGAVQVYNGLVTLQEGDAEKKKAANETIIQMFNKVDDGVNKTKDDMQAQIDKITQQITQTSSETVRAHQVGRG